MGVCVCVCESRIVSAVFQMALFLGVFKAWLKPGKVLYNFSVATSSWGDEGTGFINVGFSSDKWGG